MLLDFRFLVTPPSQRIEHVQDSVFVGFTALWLLTQFLKHALQQQLKILFPHTFARQRVDFGM